MWPVMANLVDWDNQFVQGMKERPRVHANDAEMVDQAQETKRGQILRWEIGEMEKMVRGGNIPLSSKTQGDEHSPGREWIRREWLKVNQ